jgi:glycosyltransferase involved in cell wall biosynthesis
MAKIFINALASTAGGGLTYLRNVLPKLSSWSHLHDFYVCLPQTFDADLKEKCQSFLTFISVPALSGIAGRLWWEQGSLRKIIIQQKGDLLISLGNFALLRSPVPQILFCRNELYFSERFSADLRKRKEWIMLIDHKVKTWLSSLSLRGSTAYVTPTQAMAKHLMHAGVPIEKINAIPFGFDREVFFAAQQQDFYPAQAKMVTTLPGTISLLYVSHYNYFRNFETLLAALPLIKESLNVPFRLILTTSLKQGRNYGGYKTDKVAAMIEKLGISDYLTMLGTVEYEQLAYLYQAADIFICPSYAESFGHPMLEAMAHGLPVIAANMPVHREVCADAAIYFDVFDARQLASQILRIIHDRELKDKLSNAGKERVELFSWNTHVTNLMKLVENTMIDSSH